MSDRLDTVRELLLSAPPGHFDALLKDLKSLMTATHEPLHEQWVGTVRSEYQTTARGGTSTSSSQPQHPLAKPLQDELDILRTRFFSSKGLASTCVVHDGDHQQSLVIKTFAERVDSVNLYAGSWVAQWNIDLQGDDQAQVGGQVRIQSFCFEEGNIQLLSSRDFAAVTVSGSDDVPLSKAIVDQINAFELELLSSLGEVFDQIGDQLKSIRRVLPITRTKMEWNVRAHRMVNTLSHTAPK